MTARSRIAKPSRKWHPSARFPCTTPANKTACLFPAQNIAGSTASEPLSQRTSAAATEASGCG
jgi:hypothetical protein